MNFQNHDLFTKCLASKGNGTVILRTDDGLSITIRQNIVDAHIVQETFIRKQYHVPVSDGVVVDIGGYIGDFSLYAVKYLGAKKVIVCEPIIENLEILRQNIINNNYSDKIIVVNKAVSRTGGDITLNVKINGDEVHASGYKYSDDNTEKRKVPSITVSELFNIYKLDFVDLLKIDCEGEEYNILLNMPDILFNKINHIVFEFHRIEMFKNDLEKVLDKLIVLGYTIRKNGRIIFATKQQAAQ